MKKTYSTIISIIVILALALFVISCKSAPESDTDAAKTAASSEEVEVSEGLGEVDDLEQLDKELNEIDDAGIDDLQIE